MSRILVDILPKEAKECPFAHYIRATDKTDCTLQYGLYNTRCNLECGLGCSKLSTLKQHEEKLRHLESKTWEVC